MNIETARAFLEVASTGSFQKAAENLFITQSAMSLRIKKLEARLNRKLFLRKRQGVILTPGGHTFLRHAQVMVKSWERARLEIALPKESNDVISLGVQLNHWHSLGMPWVNWMDTHMPSLLTQVRSDYSSRLMRSLRDGLIDIALVYEPQASPDIAIERFSTEELILVSTTEREVSNSQVDGYVFVDWGQQFRAQHHHAYPDVPFHRYEVGLAEVALQHILARGGSGYFVKETVKGYMQNKTLYPVANAKPLSLDIFWACHQSRLGEEHLLQAIQGLTALKENQPL